MSEAPPADSSAPSTSTEAAGSVRRSSRFLFFLFVVYCIEAGIFLCWAPWTSFWERAFFGWPWPRLGFWMLEPWARGAVTGFGLVHLVWGLHDLEAWLEWIFHHESPSAP